MTTPGPHRHVDPIIALLAQERVRQDISQRELAERFGTHSSMICLRESGVRGVSLPYLRRWMAALGVTIDPTLIPTTPPPPDTHAGGTP